VKGRVGDRHKKFRGKKNKNLEKTVKVFSSPYKLAMSFAEELVHMINESAKIKKYFTIALSGGSTPEILFKILSEKYGKEVPWQYVHFFWGDERCVKPTDPESNFGMTSRVLLSKIEIPEKNIHRIKGEADPLLEAVRYSDEISRFTEKRDGIPVFDIVLLGLGEDGHTASIFPGNIRLIESDKICDVAVQPVSNQKRITLTGCVINNACIVTFLVTGRKKAEAVEKILKSIPPAQNYPASFIVPVYGHLSWFLDQDAAGLL
jgi:6-phosphogluconolactonase